MKRIANKGCTPSGARSSESTRRSSGRVQSRALGTMSSATMSNARPPSDLLALQAMTADRSPPMVQAKRFGATEPEDTARVHEFARVGTIGSGGPLPFHDQIQKSFGRHDVSWVEAHTDSNAATASKMMGAEAFATRGHIAFAGTPTLHTAAHEAAHVVQQQAGVQLQGGIGQVGDHYERHADAVADLVVQGKSSEALLDVYAQAMPQHAPIHGIEMQSESSSVQRQTPGSTTSVVDYSDLAMALTNIRLNVVACQKRLQDIGFKQRDDGVILGQSSRIGHLADAVAMLERNLDKLFVHMSTENTSTSDLFRPIKEMAKVNPKFNDFTGCVKWARGVGDVFAFVGKNLSFLKKLGLHPNIIKYFEGLFKGPQKVINQFIEVVSKRYESIDRETRSEYDHRSVLLDEGESG